MRAFFIFCHAVAWILTAVSDIQIGKVARGDEYVDKRR